MFVFYSALKYIVLAFVLIKVWYLYLCTSIFWVGHWEKVLAAETKATAILSHLEQGTRAAMRLLRSPECPIDPHWRDTSIPSFGCLGFCLFIPGFVFSYAGL